MLSPRVLVVDDDAKIRRALSIEISASYDVIMAVNASAALAILERDAGITIIVSDYMLGHGPTGEDLLRDVLRLRSRCVRVLVSGTKTLDEIDSLLKEGVIHDFVPKPWTPGTLLDAVKRGATTILG